LLEIIIDHLEKDTARKVEFKNSFLTFWNIALVQQCNTIDLTLW
jgi:hypothetical protein